jgi:dTMP kinase
VAARGKFITLEGIDGAGKSTHLEWLAQRLQARANEVVVTREPGGTPLGEKLRELLLSESMHAETEALLMFAARREHLQAVIEPALRRGAWVLSDRFSDASFAYQGGGRGVAQNKIVALEAWVHPDLQPDLTLLFDLDVDLALRRLSQASNVPDRFECERADFFAAVRAAYLRRAQAYPRRIRIVDAALAVEQVRAGLDAIVSAI